VTGLHLNQENAAKVTDIASEALFGKTGGIVKLPDGTMVVLPTLPRNAASLGVSG
jgi:hypothetical protein